MVAITGADKHTKRLRAMTAGQSVSALGRAIYVGADVIRVEERRLIAQGAVQGRGHVASRPGEPPNYDTGQLSDEIITRKTGSLSAETSAYAPYAADLEFGTSKMEARPFARPATATKRPDIVKSVTDTYNLIIKRG